MMSQETWTHGPEDEQAACEGVLGLLEQQPAACI